MTEAAESTLRNIEPKRKKFWYGEDCKNALRKRYNVDRLQEERIMQQLQNEINATLERNHPIHDTIEEESS
ncbi:hypothetical protein ILUMI_18194 [Ignelater luminosus]|uniref:Uncharacterized protein n=1 Tax=Ignelater luminosus TaxID=2038154 RepID=A0A8K0CIH3_IGNLU|nr:hypothetical protein ILUMI_18194 [Ignelater luminosus]